MTEANLDTPELNQLFHSYVDDELVSSERNPDAFANDVYNLTDMNGQRYVMRVLKTQLPETVQVEAAMQIRLAEAGVRTPAYIELEGGGFVGMHDGTSFTLSKRIEGEAPKSASLELVADFGATLAKLHNSLEGMDVPPSKMQWFNLNNAEEDLAAYDGPLKDKLTNLIENGKSLFELDLPKSVTHGDLWLGNVFADGDKVTAVFDLETAENTYRIIDLARTYLSMRMETEYSSQELIDKLLDGYNAAAKEPLTAEERKAFGLAVAYAAGVCATWNAAHNTRYSGPYIALGEEALAAQ
ncbi:MAG: homoserine kinase type [Patescibacteria group bacterium]|nr:homoserine kinase type [Patescibacteria group bacterium]